MTQGREDIALSHLHVKVKIELIHGENVGIQDMLIKMSDKEIDLQNYCTGGEN